MIMNTMVIVFLKVRKNLNGNLKLIAGTGFKAPTLLERNVHAIK